MRDRPLVTLNRDHWASLFFLATGMGICLWAVQYDIGTLAGPGPGFMGLCAGVAVSLLSIAGFFIKPEESEGRGEIIRSPLVEWACHSPVACGVCPSSQSFRVLDLYLSLYVYPPQERRRFIAGK